MHFAQETGLKVKQVHPVLSVYPKGQFTVWKEVAMAPGSLGMYPSKSFRIFWAL
jgi:hypothetical protein